MFDYGLFRESAAGNFKQIYTIKTPGDPATSLDSRVEFATASLPSGKTRIYLGDATFFDDADGAAASLPQRRRHRRRADVQAALEPETRHPGLRLVQLLPGPVLLRHGRGVASGTPDQVFLSGSMNYDELQAFGGPGSSNGRSIVRSADAGVHVTDMTNDGKAHPNGLHPDQHALVFVRTGQGKQVFFSASDGGIWRQEGPYVDRSSDCVARGLDRSGAGRLRAVPVRDPEPQPEPQQGPADAAVPVRERDAGRRRDHPGRHAGQRHLGERRRATGSPRPSGVTADSPASTSATARSATTPTSTRSTT